MARASKFDDQLILDAMAQEVAEAGMDAATVSSVARRLDAPSGSIYHRFPTRKHLLGALWVRTVRSFYTAIESAVGDASAAELGSHVVDAVFRWISANPVGATLLLKFRTEDLIDNDWPTEIRIEIAGENQRLADITNRVAETRHVNPLDVVLALIDFPAAAARRAAVFENETVEAAIRQRTTALISQML